MTQTIKIRNEPAQHIGVVNSAPCPEMNIIAKEITENGRYEARTEGVTGFDPVIVNVPSREEIGYENGYNDGYGKGSTDGYADALAKRTELEVTANGEYIPEGESTGFSKVSVNLPSDTAVIDGLIDGTLSGAYRNDRVTTVGQYGLAYTNLTSIDLPNVISVSNYAFNSCSNLTSIYIPNAANSIGNYAFYNCKSLTELSLPKATSLGQYTAGSCSALLNVYIPEVQTIGNGCFYACWYLTSIVAQKAKSLDTNAFSNCNGLSYADFPLLESLGQLAFNSCYPLKTLILRSPSVCKLVNTNAFQSCYRILGTKNTTHNPEGLKDGYIFVPDNLLEDYRQATNWSAFADQIKPISELEE
jgi:hypothetical protein